jgi:hypothetical protein
LEEDDFELSGTLELLDHEDLELLEEDERLRPLEERLELREKDLLELFEEDPWEPCLYEGLFSSSQSSKPSESAKCK